MFKTLQSVTITIVMQNVPLGQLNAFDWLCIVREFP